MPINDSVLFPRLGEEPFNLTSEEMEQAWMNPGLDVDEKRTTEEFVKIAQPRFRLVGSAR